MKHEWATNSAFPNVNPRIKRKKEKKKFSLGKYLAQKRGCVCVLLLVFFLILSLCSQARQPSGLQNEETNTDFITTWRIATANSTVSLPLHPSGDYDCWVDWGDGSERVRLQTSDFKASEAKHTYEQKGEYRVSISGIFQGFRFSTGKNNVLENECYAQELVEIVQWGDSRFLNLPNQFAHSKIERMNTLDEPNMDGIVTMQGWFLLAKAFTGEGIQRWDVSRVRVMNRLFEHAYSFNQDIGAWNVARVESMNAMFSYAISFNQDIGGWTVGRVKSMNAMFLQAKCFNQDIGEWDVSEVKSMNAMFRHASSFNQDIGRWTVSGVEDMSMMFAHASLFNQDIGGWDVSGVKYMTAMFRHASSFNQDIGRWTVGKVENMTYMFQCAEEFNQDISRWDVRQVVDMSLMFSEARAFNQDIGRWNVGGVMYMYQMFGGAAAFTHDVSQWNVGAVVNAKYFDEETNSNWADERKPAFGVADEKQ
ncbi:MAG: BspA family leucine-rich repeat surface protein [Mangrovibacterium sp.]